MKTVILGLVLAVGLFGGCGSQANPNVTTDGCGAAFAAAAGVDKNADSVSDLYPVVRACRTIEAWSAGFTSVNGAGFRGSATEVLGNICSAPEVTAEPLCKLPR